jgi:hypothetical protein
MFRNRPRVKAGQVILTSSQVWTVPSGVKVLDVFCVGGGGGSAAGEYSDYNTRYGSGGGGGGYTSTLLNLSVLPGTQISVTIGAGGTPGTRSTNTSPFGGSGGRGGTTYFGSYLSAAGGYGSGSSQAIALYGGAGGSGGGQGGWYNPSEQPNPHHDGMPGGYDGSDGQAYTGGAGTGNHTTTRAFGESTNTLYAGGGGGGVLFDSEGTGGVGGGGNGGSDGTPNTGGGAGGADYNDTSGRYGGSGVVIVRWPQQ